MQRVATSLILSLTILAVTSAAASAYEVTLQPVHSQFAVVSGDCRSDARITHLAMPAFPWTPQAATGKTVIEIQLSPSGAVASHVSSSSGNPIFDNEALYSAQNSTYGHATQNCAKVGGSYLMTVDFTD